MIPCILTFSAVIFALNLITDLVLLVGSIKQDKVTLIVGLVLNGIAILLVVPVLLLFFGFVLYNLILFYAGSIIIIVFKIWTFVIGVGAVKEVINNQST